MRIGQVLRQKGRLAFSAGLVLLGVGLLAWPGEVMDAGRDGLTLCGATLIPSLFPFFVLSSLLIRLGLAQRVGRLLEPVMSPLFRVGGCGASALVLGLVGGYPVGARTVAELRRSGQCSRRDGQVLLCFCNNAGPAFLMGVVGAGLFGSAATGALLTLVHWASALICGLIFARVLPGGHSQVAHRSGSDPQPEQPLSAFLNAVQSSVTAMLNVCAYVILFSVLLRVLTLWGVLGAASGALIRLGLPRNLAAPLLAGILELSNGAALLSGVDRSLAIPMAALLLGWGGLSVHCQALHLLRNADLSPGPYLLAKGTQGLISAALAALALRIWPQVIRTGISFSAPLRRQLRLSPLWVLGLSAAAAAALLIGAVALKKRVEKPSPMDYNR